MTQKNKNTITYMGTGRRKTSVARVYLTPGTGIVTINHKTIETHLPSELLRMKVNAPFVTTSTQGTFDVNVNVKGGGLTGQAEAIRHGITRALLEASQDYRPALKAAGFVTRDPRAKERYKYGLRSARRKPQFSKR